MGSSSSIIPKEGKNKKNHTSKLPKYSKTIYSFGHGSKLVWTQVIVTYADSHLLVQQNAHILKAKHFWASGCGLLM